MTSAIPVNVLTGFLGSGKTSLLNRLLRDPLFSQCAVLINEFGAIGIDHHLVDRIDGDMVLLASGCICCTIRGDLASALRGLFERRESGLVPPFIRVVIETTGLADPVPVVATILYDRVLQHHFRMGNVVTTVDALNGSRNLAQYPECLKQAAVADRLVLTKLDLAAPEAVDALVQQLHAVNPTADTVRADNVDLSAAQLLGDNVFDSAIQSQEVGRWLQFAHQRQYLAIGNAGRTPSQDLAEPVMHPRGIQSFVLSLPEAINWTVFGVWLSLLLHAHGDKVLRVKGLLNVEGADTPVVLHGVQKMVYPPTHLDRWPDDDRQSRLVFIVHGLEPSAIEASLLAYLAQF
ncbi:GTP-binding protein [Rhodoferax sp.]|uniref:CobW family GTP-binding protein n=1 Tax=Rhodoferax sp. TaxID=50421 RepID=UPI0025DB310D|nr:GTP-binding protein [Rhodoferax sp.]